MLKAEHFTNMDYIINPVLMGGVINGITEDRVKINLNGRLGVIELPKTLLSFPDPKLEDKVNFYFSYIEVTPDPCDYDYHELIREEEAIPCLLGGKITEFNDTAIEVAVKNLPVIIRVPRRWVFTKITLDNDLDVEFYFSRIKLIPKA